jgi:hypothetical protein
MGLLFTPLKKYKVLKHRNPVFLYENAFLVLKTIPEHRKCSISFVEFMYVKINDWHSSVCHPELPF